MQDDPGKTREFRPSPQFNSRVNEMIAMANNIARQDNVTEAYVTMLHALGRYAAHFYRSGAPKDDEQARAEFVDALGKRLARIVVHNIRQMNGELPSGDAARGGTDAG
jgi:IS4 transposase